MICNFSLSHGCFPDALKKIKSGDCSFFNNYRPISLLPVVFLSKILERIIYNRLNAYLGKFCILYSYQFGFRKAYSTYTALICLVEKLITALKNGEYGIGIFIDFRKVFCLIWSTIKCYYLNYTIIP